jgi:hypothetical protein
MRRRTCVCGDGGITKHLARQTRGPLALVRSCPGAGARHRIGVAIWCRLYGSESSSINDAPPQTPRTPTRAGPLA